MSDGCGTRVVVPVDEQRVRELIAGAFDQLARDRWQPIATAPRDKTEILLGHPDGSMMIGHGRPDTVGWDDGDFHDHETWPTHWQPLPPGPTP